MSTNCINCILLCDECRKIEQEKQKEMTKNTPGPWRFDGHGINDAEGQRICKISHLTPDDCPTGQYKRNQQFDADSKLIAAAPELLEACQQALFEFNDPNTGPSGPKFTINMLQSAIRKATEK